MKDINAPRQAELNAAEVMKRWGYLDARATPIGADEGKDVIARFAIAEVKCEIKPSGQPYMLKLYGARKTGHEHLYFFSLAGYTVKAVSYANEVGISLWVYDDPYVFNIRCVNMSDVPMAHAHSWTSSDYIFLFHTLRRVTRVLGLGPTNHPPKRHASRKRG